MSSTQKHYRSLNPLSFHKIAYREWGQATGEIVICVHGLTGNSHDFDVLASLLASEGRRVICPDMPGRGQSECLLDPAMYTYPQYCTDLSNLLSHLGITEPESVDWIGTSMGGILGIILAAAQNSPIRSLILNDIGAVIKKEALIELKNIFSEQFIFDTEEAFVRHMRETIRTNWGEIPAQYWRDVAKTHGKRLEDGRITYAYDPAITAALHATEPADVDLFPYWDQITCPVLLLRGGQSKILGPDIAAQMKTRGPGPKMQFIEFDDCGHVPSLMVDDHINIIQKWLSTKQI